jgi:hypothetical protein
MRLHDYLSSAHFSRENVPLQIFAGWRKLATTENSATRLKTVGKTSFSS